MNKMRHVLIMILFVISLSGTSQSQVDHLFSDQINNLFDKVYEGDFQAAVNYSQDTRYPHLFTPFVQSEYGYFKAWKEGLENIPASYLLGGDEKAFYQYQRSIAAWRSSNLDSAWALAAQIDPHHSAFTKLYWNKARAKILIAKNLTKEAIEHHFAAAQLADSLGLIHPSIVARMDVAEIHKMEGRFQASHDIFEQVLADCQEHDVPLLEMRLKFQYARWKEASTLAGVHIENELWFDLDANQLRSEVVLQNETIQDQRLTAAILYDDAWSDYSLALYAQAREKCEALILRSDSLGYPSVVLNGLNFVGDMHYYQGAWTDAIEAYGRCLDSLANYPGYEMLEALCHDNLFYSYQEIGEFELATDHVEKSKSISRGKISSERDLDYTILNEIYESERKDKVIAQQELTNFEQREKARKMQLILVGVFGALAFSIITTILIVRSNRIKRKADEERIKMQEREAEQQVTDLIQNHRFEKLTATIQGEEQERDRLAKEIHDGVGGTLSGIAMKLETSDDKEEIKSLAERLRKTHDELRNISHNIAIPALEENTLVELTGNLLANVKSDHGLDVGYVYFPQDKPFALDQRLEIAAYRIIQELVNNVIKHAGAKKIELQLTRHDDGLLIAIEDDGQGFDPKSVKSGLGLKNIKERAAVYGGTVKIDSQRDRGTFISVEIPVS